MTFRTILAFGTETQDLQKNNAEEDYFHAHHVASVVHRAPFFNRYALVYAEALDAKTQPYLVRTHAHQVASGTS